MEAVEAVRYQVPVREVRGSDYHTELFVLVSTGARTQSEKKNACQRKENGDEPGFAAKIHVGYSGVDLGWQAFVLRRLRLVHS